MSLHTYDSGSRIVWTLLVGLTFLTCSLIIYNRLVPKDYEPCSETECLTSRSQIRSDALRSNECQSVCTTKECIGASNFLLGNMNQSADPCEDFYAFACGNYGEKLEKGGNHSTLEGLKDDLYRIIRDILETSKEAQYFGSAAHKLKIVYETCMNKGSSELATIRSLQEFLGHMGIPNWPHLPLNFSFSSPTLEQVIGRLATYEEEVFVRFYASYLEVPESERTEDRYFYVASQYPTYNEELEIRRLRKVVAGILRYIGVNERNINRTWDDFMAVEKDVTELYMNNSEANVICEEANATTELHIDCTELFLKEKRLLCSILDSLVRYGRLMLHFSRNRINIECEYEHYIERISNLIKRHNDRALAHYIALRVFINNLKYMNFSIRKNLKFFIKTPFESEEYITELDKWKFCISWLSENMKEPLGLMYVSHLWPKDAVEEVDEIVKEYVNATSRFIYEQDWIEEKTKRYAAREVEEEENFIHIIIDIMKNRTKINASYRKFHPTRNSFIRNILNYKKFHFFTSKLHTMNDVILEYFHPFEVNAFGGDNIYLTFGILLPPVYLYGYPKIFLHSKLGQIIGHEIGHKLTYFLGLTSEIDNRTRVNYLQRRNCLVNQYSGFELKSIQGKVRGSDTISENFPDNMAVQVTEKISKKYIQEMTDNMFSIPGLPYTPEEIFYISYAQVWCEVRSIEKEKEHLERDSHSPPEFRIKGVLQNSERFSQVFNCPSTSFMNPENKCIIFH